MSASLFSPHHDTEIVERLCGKVETFVREKVIPFEQDRRIGAHGPEDDLVTELRDLARSEGLLTPHYLGSGEWLSHRDAAPVFRAAGLSPLGPIALNVMAPDEGNMYLLSKVGTPEQKQKYLRPLISGHARSAFFMTEPNEDEGAGSDPSMLKTKAVVSGNGWVIRGRKAFITGAVGAQVGIIMAKTEMSATMFVVSLPNDAISVERVMDTLDNSMPGGHAVVAINDLYVDEADILGEYDKGFKYAQTRLAPARLTHCMRWLGGCDRAHEIAAAYAINRYAFGKQLIDHEGVGFMLADNMIDLKQSELMIDWCAGVLDENHGFATAESSSSKVAVSEALFRIADRCVQILGGTGVSGDTIVEQIFREVRAFRIYDGPSEVHRWSLAKRLKRKLSESALTKQNAVS